jgi:hypothetical protein
VSSRPRDRLDRPCAEAAEHPAPLGRRGSPRPARQALAVRLADQIVDPPCAIALSYITLPSPASPYAGDPPPSVTAGTRTL